MGFQKNCHENYGKRRRGLGLNDENDFTLQVFTSKKGKKRTWNKDMRS